MSTRSCSMPDCDQPLYLRPDVRTVCEGCRLRLNPRADSAPAGQRADPVPSAEEKQVRPDQLATTLRRYGHPIDPAQLARALHDRHPLPPRPPMYDPSALQALHQHDPELARAVLRHAGGWSAYPHTDDDFLDILDVWRAGGHAEADDPEPEGHFVAFDLATCGTGPCEVTVAHCKDCGLPVHTIGLAHRIDHDENAHMGWRAIWPTTPPRPSPEPRESA